MDKNQLLQDFYGPYNLKETQDPYAEWLFDELSDFLTVIDQNRSSIHLYTVQSDLGVVETIANRQAGEYSIVWDTGYWDLCFRFLSTMHTLSVFSPKWINEKMCVSAINQLLYETFSYFSRHFRNNEIFGSLFAVRAKEHEQYKQIDWDNSGIEDEVKSTFLFFSKLFVMQHEFEHILTDLCPEVRNHDMEWIDSLVSKQISVTIALDTDSIRDTPKHEYLDRLNKIVSPPDYKWSKEKEEIYGDLHAFSEIILFWNRKTSFPDYKNVREILVAVKLFSMFRTYTSIVTMIVEWLSNSIQKNTPPEKALDGFREETSIEVEYRQVTCFDLEICHLVDLLNQGHIEEQQLEKTQDVIRLYISTYRNMIQPLILALQNDIFSYYQQHIKQGGHT